MKKINGEDAISPAMGIVLMLAITILIGMIFYSSIDFNQIKAPVLAFLQSAEKIIPHETGMHKTSQIVKINSISGESIDVRKIRLVVEIYRENSLLLQESCHGFPVVKFGDAYCTGDDFIDKSYLGYDVLGELHDEGDGVLSAGEFIGFRIKATSGNGVKLEKGDVITVRVVDMNSGLIIARIERTVQ